MSKWAELARAAVVFAVVAPGALVAGPLGLGRPALPEEIAAWDKTVLPDGQGLPPGSGDVETGDAIFAERCASCHGDFAEGLGNWPSLAGGAGTLTDRRPVKTIGSYWPQVSTVWDYIHRSMPFGAAQTLSVDDTYAIVAFLLYSNAIVEDDFVLTHENLAAIALPNQDGFYADDRAVSEYPLFSQPPCMSDCMPGVKVTKRAVTLNVTPRDPDGRPAGTLPDLHHAAAEASAPAEAPPVPGAPDPALVVAGATVFKKCAACHKVGEGARNGVGPELNGVVGRPVAAIEGFRYSSAFKTLGEAGARWDPDRLAEFLAGPRKAVKGTKMAFAGLNKPADIDAILAYLSTFPAE